MGRKLLSILLSGVILFTEIPLTAITGYAEESAGEQVQTEMATEKPTEKTAEPTTEKSDEKTTEKVTEKETEKTTEKATEKQTEAAANGETSTQAQTEAAQNEAEAATEKTAEEVMTESGTETVTEAAEGSDAEGEGVSLTTTKAQVKLIWAGPDGRADTYNSAFGDRPAQAPIVFALKRANGTMVPLHAFTLSDEERELGSGDKDIWFDGYSNLSTTLKRYPDFAGFVFYQATTDLAISNTDFEHRESISNLGAHLQSPVYAPAYGNAMGSVGSDTSASGSHSGESTYRCEFINTQKQTGMDQTIRFTNEYTSVSQGTVTLQLQRRADGGSWANVTYGADASEAEKAAHPITKTIDRAQANETVSITDLFGTDLPAFNSEGKAYTYRAMIQTITMGDRDITQEYAITEADNGANLTARCNSIKTTLSVKVEWDAPLQYISNISTVNVSLQRRAAGSNAAWNTISVSDSHKKSGSWSLVASDLDKYKSYNQLYEYRAVPTGLVFQDNSKLELDDSNQVGGFSVETIHSGDSAHGFASTCKFKARRSNLVVKMDWDDADNQDGLRPEQMTVKVSSKVQGETEATVTTLTLDEANNWEVAVNELPIATVKGEAITYEVSEAGLPTSGEHPYRESTNQTTKTLTLTEEASEIAFINSCEPVQMKITAKKKDPGERISYDDLLEEVPITLQFKVDGVPGYTDYMDVDADSAALLGIRAEEAVTKQSRLDAQTKTYDTVSWTDLPVCLPGQVGKLITYRVIQRVQSGDNTTLFSSEITPTGKLSEKSLEGSNWQNLEVPDDTVMASLNLTHAWRKEKSYMGSAITSATFALQRRLLDDNGVWEMVKNGNMEQTVVLERTSGVNGIDCMNAAFTNLPAFDTYGTWYEYRVIQTGFTVDDEGASKFVPVVMGENQTKGTIGGYDYVITTLRRKQDTTSGYNEYDTYSVNTVKTVSVGAWNIWDDNQNLDQKRPDTVVFHLLKDGEDVTSETLTLSDQLSWKKTDMSNYDLLWTGLPQYNEDGTTEFTYTVAMQTADGSWIEDSGNLSKDYSVHRQNMSLGTTNGFLFTDFHNATELSFGKLAADPDKGTRTPLNGAVFGIYTDKACTALVTTAVSGKSIGTTSSKDGQIRVRGVLKPDTTYYVKELASSQADLTAGNDTDNIGEDPTVYTVSFNGQQTAGLLTASGGVVVNIVDRIFSATQTQAVVEKKDDQGNLIGGYVLQITDKYGNAVKDMNGNIVQNIVTQAGKPLEIKGLRDGDYVIREVSAPKGYTVSQKPMALTIDNTAIAIAAENHTTTSTVVTTTVKKVVKTSQNKANAAASGNIAKQTPAITAPVRSTASHALLLKMIKSQLKKKIGSEHCQGHFFAIVTYITVTIRKGWIAR